MSSDGDVSVTEQDFDVFVKIVSKLWGEDSFEDELLPGVLGLNPEDKKDYEILESMTLIGAFGAFITAFMYMMSDADDEEFQQAIGDLWEVMKKYNPELYGFTWADEDGPRFQLEPQGYRGYIEARPVRQANVK